MYKTIIKVPEKALEYKVGSNSSKWIKVNKAQTKIEVKKLHQSEYFITRHSCDKIRNFYLQKIHATFQKVKRRKAEQISPDFKLNFSQFSNYQKKILRLSNLRHQKEKYFKNRYKPLTFLLKIQSNSQSVVSLRGIEPLL